METTLDKMSGFRRELLRSGLNAEFIWIVFFLALVPILLFILDQEIVISEQNFKNWTKLIDIQE